MIKKMKAWLRKNVLTSDPNDYVAIPVTNGSISIDDIVEELVREGMELKRETVIDVINRFNRKVISLVVAGYNVSTGLVHIHLTIKGPFYGKTWNPDINSLIASIHQSMALRTALAEVEVEILGEQADLLEIFSLTDSTTGKTDGTLTPGRNAEIKGSYLKIVGENPDCGVSFTNTVTGEVFKLPATDIVLNEPSRLLIMVPTLATGEYALKVTTQFSSGNTLLKQPRSAIFGTPAVII